MDACDGGAIVNVSSVHRSTDHQRLAAYAASKGAIDLLSRTFAIEWAAKGVLVNAVAPRYLVTDMTAGLRDHPMLSQKPSRNIPMGRYGDAGEVVPAVLSLAGPASSYVTSSTVLVDAGWTAR